jgi:hypothetical protein
VYALGGVDRVTARECVRAGAHGIAALGSVMGARHPSQEVASILGEIARATVVLVGDASYWVHTGVFGALRHAGFRVLRVEGDAQHIAAALAREPEGLTLVANSEGRPAAEQVTARLPGTRLIAGLPEPPRSAKSLDAYMQTFIDEVRPHE